MNTVKDELLKLSKNRYTAKNIKYANSTISVYFGISIKLVVTGWFSRESALALDRTTFAKKNLVYASATRAAALRPTTPSAKKSMQNPYSIAVSI